jgi:hypothetical protein
VSFGPVDDRLQRKRCDYATHGSVLSDTDKLKIKPDGVIAFPGENESRCLSLRLNAQAKRKL